MKVFIPAGTTPKYSETKGGVSTGSCRDGVWEAWKAFHRVRSLKQFLTEAKISMYPAEGGSCTKAKIN